MKSDWMKIINKKHQIVYRNKIREWIHIQILNQYKHYSDPRPIWFVIKSTDRVRTTLREYTNKKDALSFMIGYIKRN